MGMQSVDELPALDSAQELARLATGRWSLLHCLSERLLPRRTPFWARLAQPYVVGVGLSFALPCVLGLCDPGFSWGLGGQCPELGFFTDPSTLFMSLVTFPVTLTFLLVEDRGIAEGLSAVAGSGAVTLDRDAAFRLRGVWASRYRKANVAGQLLGAVVGVGASVVNYLVLSEMNSPRWQFSGSRLTMPGLYSFWVYQPLFWFVLVVYCVRSIMKAGLLRSVGRESAVSVQALHEDGAGGLAPVGTSCLWTHAILVVFALNILLFWVNTIMVPEAVPGRLGRVLALIAAYVVLCPFAFFVPLLPFHRQMRRVKSDQVRMVTDARREEYERSMVRLPRGSVDDHNGISLSTLRDLAAIADDLPVWPVNTGTVRRFVGMYLLPILAFVGSLLGKYVVALLLSVSSGGSG